MELVTRLGSLYSEKLGREIDPLTQVTVTVGASEALFALLQSLINPGAVCVCVCACVAVWLCLCVRVCGCV